MEQHEAFKRIREESAKNDLIGAVYRSEVYDLLGFHKIVTEGETDLWKAFSEALENVAGNASVMQKNGMEDLARNFGNEREEKGFRLGFHTAMRLCMEGLFGGAR